jgi:preprotein translocase subunit SecA
MSVVNAVSKALVKVFGSRNERLIKSYRRRVEKINALEPQIRPLTDAQLRDLAQDLRRRCAAGEKIGDLMFQALAVMREATDRNIGIRNIFNPAHEKSFDPGKLAAEHRAMYDQVRVAIAQTPPSQTLGSEALVPSWLSVDIPPALYDAVREIYPTSRPPFRARPFDVQLIGGMVLSEGKIAEMKTGEGKTIVAPLACFLAAVEGLKCYVVTVNDYLVQRDRDWVFPAFHKLGFTVGAIHPQHMQPPDAKQRAYRCDVVYGTNSEYGFDYLRDNMKLTVAEQVQTRRDFCIVDEIDSILIDEARTPLIISGAAHDDAPQYLKANQVAEHLKGLQQKANAASIARLKGDVQPLIDQAARQHKVPPAQIEKIITKFRDLGPDFIEDKEADMIGHVQYYVVKKEQKQAHMTPRGVEEAQKAVGQRFYVVGNDMGWDHLISNALRAHTVYERDRQYVVQDGEVIIVDEFTGRLMIGRQWSDGLHQAVEAKEARHGVKIKEETQTLATITIQNFFKLFKRLAGMTGTAMTEAQEFHEIYNLEVVQIPTNMPVVRADADDLIYLTEKAKWDAILEEIRQKHEAGRPVLVGTTSVETSERLSQMLTKKHGIEHEVLNAKQHEREAHIVARAGQQHVDRRQRAVGNVTIATNMAGRGTDIKLSPEVLAAGGLHIVGTERHESRRIDNQLRGRAGRQGDAGSSRFFISMEDDLMKIFAGKTTMRALAMLGMKEDEAIEHRWITRSVERAQRKVEERNFQIRKNLLEYDEVMEHQRNTFYSTRQAVLEGRRIKQIVFDYIAQAIEDAVQRCLDPDYPFVQVAEVVRTMFHGTVIDPTKLRGESVGEIEAAIYLNAKSDARQQIEITVGEYMASGAPPEEWDLAGLARWAMTVYSADLKIAELHDMNPEQVVDRLTEIAHDLIDRKSVEGLAPYYEKTYAAGELAEWARQKYGLELDVQQMLPRRGERQGDFQQRVADLIYKAAFEAYQRREIEYPVGFVLDTVSNAVQQGAEGSAWAARELVAWANHRFALGWTAEQVVKMNGAEIQRVLLEESAAWRGPKLEQWATQAAREAGADRGKLNEAFQRRWGLDLLGPEDAAPADPVTALKDKAVEILRTELAQLERFVLLQILDQSWKDHLFAMDQLKDSIGLRGFAEKDPKIEYKSEGSRYFKEMLRGVRDQVTDMIFRARLTSNVQVRNVYQDQQAVHQTIQNTGVGAADAAPATEQQQEDLRAAERAGAGERRAVAPIVNTAPQVGRNDPCPCGSGRKYKKCCGAHAA